MNGFHQRYALFAQFIDHIELQDAVVDDDSAGDDQSDGAHQVERMTGEPEQSERETDVDGNFNQYNERLQETFELRRKDKVHEQHRYEQNHNQFAQHLLIGEKTSQRDRKSVV